MKKILIVLMALIVACGAFAGCITTYSSNTNAENKPIIETTVIVDEVVSTEQETPKTPSVESTEIPIVGEQKDSFSMSMVPDYDGVPYVAVNNNESFFKPDEIVRESYEEYAPLDELGRCGVTISCIGEDIMPTEDRGEIGSVKPTGWHTVKYDCVDGKYLYNRCHLIGFQLTGENANTSNLITGTRYMNVDGMLPFENMVADYVKETKNHVMYRVTPIYEGDNLVAEGVLMEAVSVEDDGEGILFCVFCYNVQPGVTIDYATGESWLADEEPETDATTDGSSETKVYILNTNSKKFHLESCSGLPSSNNREDFEGTRDEVVNMGYSPCGNCKP